MKTTLDIADSVITEAKAIARRDGTTVRALVEEGLRHVLAARNDRQPFRLRDASVDGQGLSPDFAEGGWARLRDAIYEGRGG